MEPGISPGSADNDLMQSIQDLLQAVAENPKDYKLIVQTGNAYFDIGRFEKAIQFYKRALQIKDQDLELQIDLGVAYFNLSRLDSALFFIGKALAKNPDHKQALYNIGIVHYNLGQSAEAINVWERLIKMHADSPEAEAVKKYIDEIKKHELGT